MQGSKNFYKWSLMTLKFDLHEVQCPGKKTKYEVFGLKQRTSSMKMWELLSMITGTVRSHILQRLFLYVTFRINF